MFEWALVYLSRKLQRVGFGVFVRPLWEEVSRVEGAAGGCIPFSSFTDRKWASSVPAFLQQMFDRENIFTAGERMGGKLYVLQYITVEVVKTEGEKPHLW